MAGNYPDVPNHRLAWDKMGVRVFTGSVAGGFSTELTQANMTAMNHDVYTTAGGTGGTTDTVLFVFPEPVDITHVTGIIDSVRWESWTLMGSVNSTNGVDGTWNTMIAAGTSSSAVNGRFQTRANIRAVSSNGTGIKQMRWTNTDMGSGNGSGHHLYGGWSAGSNPHRLELWHATLDQRLAPAALDWGDAAQGSTADKAFRVKNLSPTLTCSNITASFEVLTEGNPTVGSQHSLSNGGAFAPTTSAGTLGPGQISPALVFRRSLLSTAQLGPFTGRLNAAGTWA